MDILSLGRKVDPVILGALSQGSPSDFIPALKYHFEVGGKRMRAALTILSCSACGGTLQDSLRPAAVVEMIHNYSLVMDDLIDRARVRRGRPTVRVKTGDSASLLIAMYYREVLDEVILSCSRSSAVREIAVQVMKEIINGERLDLLFEQAGRKEPYFLKNRITNPGFANYLEMIGKKTASLFKASAEMGGLSAGASKDVIVRLGEFGWKSGIAFQIMDDILDVFGQRTGKQSGKDIIEHKLGNAVIMIALRYLSRHDGAELLRILKSSDVSSTMARRAVDLIKRSPAEREGREIATRFLDEAKNSLSVLGQSQHKRSLFQLTDLIASRNF